MSLLSDQPPASSAHKAVLVADFNLYNFAGYLRNDPGSPRLEVVEAPFGQVMQVLLNEQLDCWKTEPEIALVWTRPEMAIKGFGAALRYEVVDPAEVLAEVDAYCEALQRPQERLRWMFVPTWTLPPSCRGLGALDLKPGGIGHLLFQMNCRLMQHMSERPNCFVLDAGKWMSRVGERAFNPKLWYLGKIGFSNDVFKEAVRDIKSAVRGFTGQVKKVILLDLDETLWGGVVGDAGWQNLVLGGHDPAGEAFVDFQQELKALKRRGVLLAIVSKNEESVALEAIRKHPEMVLRQEDFAGWRISWEDKAKGISELLSELNLGHDSAVFIDDNPVERARVKEALPSVFVPNWPEDKLLYREALRVLDCFDSGTLTTEDRHRAEMYAGERERRRVKETVSSVEDWLKTLDMHVTVEVLNDENLARVTQLLNKTNQMNLSTRRLTSQELRDWSSNGNCRTFSFRVSDRLGDSGLTGILSVKVEEDTLRIVDFILSCRVMGRQVENIMLSIAARYGRARGLQKLSATYIPTEKNKPCLDFLRVSGLTPITSTDVFSWDLAEEYSSPQHIKVLDETLCLSTVS